MVIKILGLDKCLKKFGDISDIDMMPVITESTRKVQKRAKELVPVDTGQLRQSIKTRSDKKQQAGAVYTSSDHAIYPEFGTRYQRAQPYLQPALQEEAPGIRRAMQKHVKDELKKRSK